MRTCLLGSLLLVGFSPLAALLWERVNSGKKPQEFKGANFAIPRELGGTSTAAILEATEQTSDDALQQQTSIEGTVPA